MQEPNQFLVFTASLVLETDLMTSESRLYRRCPDCGVTYLVFGNGRCPCRCSKPPRKSTHKNISGWVNRERQIIRKLNTSGGDPQRLNAIVVEYGFLPNIVQQWRKEYGRKWELQAERAHAALMRQWSDLLEEMDEIMEKLDGEDMPAAASFVIPKRVRAQYLALGIGQIGPCPEVYENQQKWSEDLARWSRGEPLKNHPKLRRMKPVEPGVVLQVVK